MSDQHKIWVLSSSLVPKEATIVKRLTRFGSDYAEINSGRWYAAEEIYESRSAALEAAWVKLTNREVKHRKSGERLQKIRLTLEKATGAGHDSL